MSDARTGDRAYFDALHRDCENPEVQSAFLHKMLHVDLTGFYTGNIPESQGLRDQRYFSMNSVQKWLVDCLINESFEAAGSDKHHWPVQMTSNELYALYVAYCDAGRLGEYRRLTQCKMATYLGQIFQKIRRVNAGGPRGFYFGEVPEDAVRAFERYEKLKLSELGG